MADKEPHKTDDDNNNMELQSLTSQVQTTKERAETKSDDKKEGETCLNESTENKDDSKSDIENEGETCLNENTENKDESKSIPSNDGPSHSDKSETAACDSITGNVEDAGLKKSNKTTSDSSSLQKQIKELNQKASEPEDKLCEMSAEGKEEREKSEQSIQKQIQEEDHQVCESQDEVYTLSTEMQEERKKCEQSHTSEQASQNDTGTLRGQHEINSLQKQIQDLNQQNSELQGKICKLSEELQEERKKCEQSQAAGQTLANDNEALRGKLKKGQDEIISFQQQIQDLNQQISESQDKMCKMLAELKEEQKKCEQKHASEQTLQSVNEVLRGKLKEGQDEINNLREETAWRKDLEINLGNIIQKLEADLRAENTRSRTAAEQLEATFNHEKDKMTKELQKEKRLCSQLKEQNGSLQQSVKSKEEANKKKDAEIQKLIKENKSFKKDAADENKKFTKMAEEKRKQELVVKELQSKNMEATKNISQLSWRIKELDRNVQEKEKTVKQQTVEISQLQYKTHALQSKLDESLRKENNLEKEKGDLTLRLSKLAGANLTYNNPNIADLSDENRPTKLAEEFSELYDNEWTDAFEVIDIIDETEKIQYMQEILKKANKLCQETTQNHVNAIKEGFATLSVRDESKDDMTEVENEETGGVNRQSRDTKQPGHLAPDSVYMPAAVDTSNKDFEELSVKDNVDLKGESRVSHEAQTTVASEEHLESPTSELQQKPDKYPLEVGAQNTNDKETANMNDRLDKTANNFREESTTAADHDENVQTKTNFDEFKRAEREKVKQYDETMTGNSESNGNKNYLNTDNAKSTQAQQAKEVLFTVEDKGDGSNQSDKTENVSTAAEDELLVAPNIAKPVNDQYQVIKEQLETPDGIEENGKFPQPCNKEKNDKRTDDDKETQNDHAEDTVDMLEYDRNNTKIANNQSETEQLEDAFSLPGVTKITKHNGNPESYSSNYNNEYTNDRLELLDDQSNTDQTGPNDVESENKATFMKRDVALPTKPPLVTNSKAQTKTEENKPTAGEVHQVTVNDPVDLGIHVDDNTNNDNFAIKTVTGVNKAEVVDTGQVKKTLEQSDTPEDIPTIDDSAARMMSCDQTNGNDNMTSKVMKVTKTAAYHTVAADFEQLRNEQKKSILEIRTFFEKQLSTQFEEKCVAIVTGSMKENLKSDDCVIKYIRKCLNVCWSMCRHEPPVYIGFHEFKGDLPFDNNVFKAYTKSGKYVDFVVWPPLYLHEGGPLLSKGVAQGRKE